MNEHDFLQTLQQRAKEQKQLMNGMPFPRTFGFISEWLSVHPWRFLIPLAFLISVMVRTLFGEGYTDVILFIFRKL